MIQQRILKLSWKNTKSKVKKDADLVAQELVNLYAKRKMSEGIKFDEDTTWQVELEDAFEWVKFRMKDERDISYEDMYTPESNVEYGSYLIKLLYEEYGDDNNQNPNSFQTQY